MLARIAREAHPLRRALLDLLFPPRCVICRSAGEWLCAACRAEINKVQPPICSRCGRPLNGEPCPYCQILPLQIDGMRAVAFFEGVMREAIHRFKYHRQTELAATFGEMLNDYLAANALPFDAIIPVPLHRDRECARGYNQSLLLARELAARHPLDLWEDVLMRVRPTRAQVELDAIERRENVRDAFAAIDRVADTRVLLIDDVCTTGATMEACGIALKRCRAKSVWGLALARPRFASEVPANDSPTTARTRALTRGR